MFYSDESKEQLKTALVDSLNSEKEVRKIVIFGSFPYTSSPNDLDVAVFQDSADDYLKLALKYRKKIRALSNRIPIDIFPVKSDVQDSPFLSEIANGVTIYER